MLYCGKQAHILIIKMKMNATGYFCFSDFPHSYVRFSAHNCAGHESCASYIYIYVYLGVSSPGARS